ncbi:hypothetical protein [Streptosporangium sp. NPDC002607]
MLATRAGQTAYELGLAFGVAATGSVMAAVYRNHVQAASPAGAPADVVREAAGNLGGGLAIAERLPGELGEAMAATVHNAFASGLHAAAIISGGPAAALLVLALLLLRRVAPPAPEKPLLHRKSRPTVPSPMSSRGKSSKAPNMWKCGRPDGEDPALPRHPRTGPRRVHRPYNLADPWIIPSAPTTRADSPFLLGTQHHITAVQGRARWILLRCYRGPCRDTGNPCVGRPTPSATELPGSR